MYLLLCIDFNIFFISFSVAQKLDSGAGMYEVHITDTENPQVHFEVFQSFVVRIY